MATVGRPPRTQPLKLVLKPRRTRPQMTSRRAIVAGLAVVLLVAVWLAPWIAGRSGLRQGIVNWAVPNNGRIEVGSASLGCTSHKNFGAQVGC